MKNARKLLLGLMALGAVVVGFDGAWAAKRRPTPSGNDGARINHPLYGGYEYSHIRDANAGVQVCNGRCLLAAVLMGTAPPTSHVTFLDTNANGLTAGTAPFGPINFTDVASSAAAWSNQMALPMLLTNGLKVKLSAASNGEAVTVLYVDLDD